MFEFNKTKYRNFMKNWEDERPEYKTFVHDGIIGSKDYCSTEPRILFLLKETYDSFADIATEEEYYPKDGNSTHFWRKINIIKYIIQNSWNGNPIKEKDIDECKELPITGIAYVNIKKYAQNNSTSDFDDLKQYAEKDADFLRTQISLLSPQVIICCGTLDLYNSIYPENKLKQLNDEIQSIDNCLVINSYHPSYMGESFEQLYEWLSKSIKAKSVQNEINKIKNM